MKKFFLAAVMTPFLSAQLFAADVSGAHCATNDGDDYYYGQLQNLNHAAVVTNLKGGYYACTSEDDYYTVVDKVGDEYYDDGEDGELVLDKYPNNRHALVDVEYSDCSRLPAGARVKVLETNRVRAARIEMCNGGQRLWTHVDNLIGWHPDIINPDSSWQEDSLADPTQSVN